MGQPLRDVRNAARYISRIDGPTDVALRRILEDLYWSMAGGDTFANLGLHQQIVSVTGSSATIDDAGYRVTIVHVTSASAVAITLPSSLAAEQQIIIHNDTGGYNVQVDSTWDVFPDTSLRFYYHSSAYRILEDRGVTAGRFYAYDQYLDKFGYNDNTATGDDVWVPSSSFAIPSTPGNATFVSTSTDDDVGGVGCTEVTAFLVDTNYDEYEVAIAMDGTTNVTNSDHTWLWCNRLRATDGANNVGNITCTIDSTTVGYMPAGIGSTQQAIVLVPNATVSGQAPHITSWHVGLGKGSGTVVSAVMTLYRKPYGKPKFAIDGLALQTDGTSAQDKQFEGGKSCSPGEFVWVRTEYISTTGLRTEASFTIVYV